MTGKIEVLSSLDFSMTPLRNGKLWTGGDGDSIEEPI
jgi:hypothetical protein